MDSFQSTLPRGERHKCNFQEHHDEDFNPRSREGSDQWMIPSTIDFGHFNPRSREGSDEAMILQRSHEKISIHAPARGATRMN